MNEIKAIETLYAGCRFRSRLEARWAVFFDTLKIEWQYEPQGFELPSGRYLPDFRLPAAIDRVRDLWFEVKGRTATKREWTLAWELSEMDRCPVVIAAGDIPRPEEVKNFAVYGLDTNMPSWAMRAADWDQFGPDVREWAWMQLGACRWCGRVRFSGWGCPNDHSGWYEGRREGASRIKEALIAARSARFEFGESG